jgi:transposase
MDSITRIRVAYALRKQGIAVEAIAGEVGRDRATVYRWLKGIKQRGIEGYIRHYRAAKKGRRRRKVHSYIVQRVLSIRRAYRDCCGQKIVYLLAQEGIKLSLSTVYRLLRQYRQLRKHTRTAKGQPARRGQAPREVVQMDTVELGEVFAFTAIDTYTREAFILMRPGLTSADGKAALEELARRFGPIQTLQTDAGSEFEAQFLAVVNQYASSMSSPALTARTTRRSSSVLTARCAEKSSDVPPSRGATWPSPNAVPMTTSPTITTSALTWRWACAPLLRPSRSRI